MEKINFVRQPNWILDSASQNTDNLSLLINCLDNKRIHAWEIIKPGLDQYFNDNHEKAKSIWINAQNKDPGNIFLLRTINHFFPEILQYRYPKLSFQLRGKNIAIIIPGELRLIDKSTRFFEILSNKADIFICTSKEYEKEANQIKFAKAISIIDKEPNLKLNSMHQWHKLNCCLEMVKKQERLKKNYYSHILKLRTDYFHINPVNLHQELLCSDGIIGASDKVFGGRRELMMLFSGFYHSLLGWFYKKDSDYWPINIDQIIGSDDNIKWYGMRFPKSMVGNPKTVSDLRNLITNRREELSLKLQSYQMNQGSLEDSYSTFFKGNPIFPSEVCYAKFLNFNGIYSHTSESLKGFLRSDRIKK